MSQNHERSEDREVVYRKPNVTLTPSLFTLAENVYVPSATMEEAEFNTYTAASLEGADD